MTFHDRMVADTGTPMPRYLYLLLKPAETIAIAAGVSALSGAPILLTAWATVAAYVAVGLFVWYRHGVAKWIGPGSLTGDALYHTLASLPAPVMLWPGLSLAVRWTVLVAGVLTWWVVDTAGYGPARSAP